MSAPARLPRILQVVADGRPGGGTTVVLGLCADLHASGEWEVHVATQPGSYAAERAAALGLQAHSVDCFALARPLRMLAVVRHILRKVNPDVMHLHGMRGAVPFAWMNRLGARVPTAYTVHGYHFQKKHGLARRSGLWLERLASRLADTTVFVSAADQRIAQDCSLLAAGASTAVIPNGIDEADVRRLASAHKSVDLAFMGRLVEQKNPLFVLDVVHELAPQKVRALVIGGGPLEEPLRARTDELGLGELVEFTGELPREQALQRFSTALLGLFPSRWEGLPMTPMEAAALGVPLVASRIGGTDEVILHGRTGVLVDGFDPRAYADEIRRLLATPAARAGMVEQGRLFLAENFTRERCTGQYVAAYRRLRHA